MTGSFEAKNAHEIATMAAPGELWGDYWVGAGLHGCTEQFPPDVRQQIAATWHDLFAELKEKETLLDIGCGRGAVLAAAREAGAFARGVKAVGVDLAPAPAITGEGFDIRGGIDAGALPFANGSFTLVTGQFGVEYAGLDRALNEVARVAAADILLLTHAAEGIVAAHAGEQAEQAATLLGEKQFGGQLHAAVAQRDPALFDTMLADVAALAQRASNHGLLEQIYGSIAELRRLVGEVRTSELAAAVDYMVAQLEQHQERMGALARAAPTRADIEEGASRLRAAGFTAAVREQRSPREDLVGYWLEASRTDQA